MRSSSFFFSSIVSFRLAIRWLWRNAEGKIWIHRQSVIHLSAMTGRDLMCLALLWLCVCSELIVFIAFISDYCAIAFVQFDSFRETSTNRLKHSCSSSRTRILRHSTTLLCINNNIFWLLYSSHRNDSHSFIADSGVHIYWMRDGWRS